MSLTASHDDNHLLVSVRTQPDADAAAGCARGKPPPSYHHKAGTTGHVVWIALPTAPSG
jgi:hypothetical protein